MGRCSRCGTPLEFKGQVICLGCGVRFVSAQEQAGGTQAGGGEMGGVQAPDTSLNRGDINKVQYS